ncbi:MAG TPA: hypothetical protein VKB88_12620 [Bryobacteraceae bacterium]|nr:hypothetical protein [Bryobacteraceae bacterium]
MAANPIVASNIGRYGKKADEDDLGVIKTGQPNLEVNATGYHFEGEMALHDTSGKVIGAIAEVYNFKDGDDKEALHTKAETVRAEIEKLVPSVDKLTGRHSHRGGRMTRFLLQLAAAADSLCGPAQAGPGQLLELIRMVKILGLRHPGRNIGLAFTTSRDNSAPAYQAGVPAARRPSVKSASRGTVTLQPISYAIADSVVIRHRPKPR